MLGQPEDLFSGRIQVDEVTPAEGIPAPRQDALCVKPKIERATGTQAFEKANISQRRQPAFRFWSAAPLRETKRKKEGVGLSSK